MQGSRLRPARPRSSRARISRQLSPTGVTRPPSAFSSSIARIDAAPFPVQDIDPFVRGLSAPSVLFGGPARHQPLPRHHALHGLAARDDADLAKLDDDPPRPVSAIAGAVDVLDERLQRPAGYPPRLFRAVQGGIASAPADAQRPACPLDAHPMLAGPHELEPHAWACLKKARIFLASRPPCGAPRSPS